MWSLAGLLSSFRASLSFWLIISAQTSQLKSERQRWQQAEGLRRKPGRTAWGRLSQPRPGWEHITCWAPRRAQPAALGTGSALRGVSRREEHVPAGHRSGRGRHGRPPLSRAQRAAVGTGSQPRPGAGHVPAGHGGGRRGAAWRPAALQAQPKPPVTHQGLRGPQVPRSTETCGERAGLSAPLPCRATHPLDPRQRPHATHGAATPGARG